MNNQDTYHIELVDQYFAGKLQEPELSILMEWVSEKEENKLYFEKQSKLWKILYSKEVEQKIDVNEEWKEFKSKAFKTNTKVRNINEKSQKNQWLRIAAIGFILIASVLTMFLLTRNTEEILTGNNELAVNQLPDGSQITLNEGSTLSFDKGFNKEKRKVQLKGNAYFDIEPDSVKPFLISVNKLVVEVLGTSFFVNEADEQTEVVVNSGIVGIYYLNKPEEITILTAGERAIGKHNGSGIEKELLSNENSLAWKTKKIAFLDESMSSIMETISLVYGYEVVLMNPDIENCRITASFDQQPIESVIKVLEATLDLKINQKENLLEINGEGCAK